MIKKSKKKASTAMAINMNADVYYFMQTQTVDNVLVPPPGQNWLLVEWRADHALWACELKKLPPEIRNTQPRMSSPSPAAPYYPPVGAGQQGYVPPRAPIQSYNPNVVDAEDSNGGDFTDEELGADPSTPAGRAIMKRLADERAARGQPG